MRYAQHRSSIRTGDVLAWSHRAAPWASWYDFKIWLVRLFTRSEFSHVAVAVRFAGRVFVLEAVTGGIRMIPLSKMLPCYHLKDTKPFDVERAMSVCGEPYSELEAVLGELGMTDATNGRWQCSEFVVWAKYLLCKATPSAVVNDRLQAGATLTEISL